MNMAMAKSTMRVRARCVDWLKAASCLVIKSRGQVIGRDSLLQPPMAPKRKPIPRTNTPSNDTAPQEPADPRLPRYTLSDSDVPSTATFENIGDQHPEQSSRIDPFQDVTASLDSQSSSSHHDAHSTIEYKPYQPGQYLAPIITGETLQLDPEIPTAPPSTTHSDPFYDPATPISLHQPNPLNPAVPTEYYYNQDHQAYVPPPDQSFVSSYEHSTLPAASEIDHFHHDAEAYASGNYSRASYRPPRSRSPTPAVDDEDYFIVGNESVHYRGYPDTSLDYDPEKEALHRQHSATERSYYAERGYLPNGHAIVYDPEPETPTSTLNSLPPETPSETRHFGPAPSGRILRRHKTKRRVQLTNGNLVMDLNIPPKLVLPCRGEPENMKTRYTAVTCDPDQFEKKGFFLRQNETGRRTELFIVITMYNVRFPFLSLIVVVTNFAAIYQEDEVLFCRTLYGVMRNIAHLCTRKNSQTWGPNAWEKVRYNSSICILFNCLSFSGRCLHRCRWAKKGSPPCP